MPSYHPLNIEVINPHETFKTLGCFEWFLPQCSIRNHVLLYNTVLDVSAEDITGLHFDEV